MAARASTPARLPGVADSLRRRRKRTTIPRGRDSTPTSSPSRPGRRPGSRTSLPPPVRKPSATPRSSLASKTETRARRSSSTPGAEVRCSCRTHKKAAGTASIRILARGRPRMSRRCRRPRRQATKSGTDRARSSVCALKSRTQQSAAEAAPVGSAGTTKGSQPEPSPSGSTRTKGLSQSSDARSRSSTQDGRCRGSWNPSPPPRGRRHRTNCAGCGTSRTRSRRTRPSARARHGAGSPHPQHASH